MIPAADIQDQELSVGSERSGIDHPTVGWRGHLSTGAGGDGNALFRPAMGVGRAELLQFHAVNRNWNLSAQRGEGARWGQPSDVAERRQRRAAVAARRLTRLAHPGS